MSQKPHNIQSAFSDIRADYDATRYSRFVRRRTGVAAMGSGPDYHIRTEAKYYELIEQARDMDRNDGLVGILADRRVDNIVQSGFTLDPKTGDKGLDNALWQWWEDFSNDPDQCDITGEFTWKEIERQCCRSESIDGDIVVTGTEEGSFQLLESHLIRTKSKVEDTFLGVTTDRVCRRVKYHVADELSEFGQFGDVTPIDVRNAEGIRQVFHVFDPKRVNLTRGITQLAPVFSLSGMLEDINFAKLVQQQVVSCFAVFRKMAAGGNRLPSADGYGDTKTETTPVGTRQLEGVSPGMEVIGQPGEELQGFSPNVPNSEYFQQVKLILQIIGVNFGLPLCLVLMDGSETNFSGWRGAVDEARKGFVADQMNLVRRLNKGAYKWRLWWDLQQRGSEFRKAFSKIGEAIFRHNWNLPTWSYIEPVADAQGDAEQLKNGLTSPRRLHAARGKDWEEIAEECIEDNAYAITRAQQMAAKINEQFPDAPQINWRDLVALPMPEGMTMSMQDPAAVAVQEDAAKNHDEAKKPQAKARAKKKNQPKASKEFDESKITRDDDGKFGTGGGGSTGNTGLSQKQINGKTASEWRDEYELPDGWFVHGRRGKQDLSTGNVIQLTQDWGTAEQYAGRDGSEWMIAPKADASVADMTDSDKTLEIAAKFIEAYKDGRLSPELDEIASSVDPDDLESFAEQLAPPDIVDSARMWDSRDFCAWVYDEMKIDFVVVDDGAVVLNRDAIESHKAAGSKKNPQAQAKKKVRAQSESMKESMLQAEILLHIYGDDAEEVLFGSGPQAAFDESKVKRDEKGRFASKGSAGALKAAKESLSRALQGDRTRQSARQLSDHLENLTVKQLTELKKEYGIKASGPTKKALIEKLADRLDRGRRTPQTEEKPAEKKRPAKEKRAPDPATQQDADKLWSQQTPEQQRQTFRESMLKETETSRAQLWKAQDAHVMAVTKEQVVVRDIDRQTMRLAKAQAKLARKPDDEKAKNEARIAQQKLSDLESKLAPLRTEMQRTNEARQQAREKNDTVVSRMMGSYIDRVNSTQETKQEAADKLAAVQKMHSSGQQITEGKSWLQLRGSQVEETYKTSLEIAATENVTAERKKGERILTGLANARFHAQAMSHPIVYEKNVRAYAQKGGIVALSQSDGANTYLHEFGHHIEHDNKQADKLLTEFLNKRVGSEPTTKLAEKFPDGNFDASEVGRKDDFVKTIQAVYGIAEKAAEKKAYYIGKKYMSGATEIMSMGIEMLSRNAEAFAKSDPEYFDLITGILSGQMLESKP